jgi:hypothetical protein
MSISPINTNAQTQLVPSTLLGYSSNGVSALEINPSSITIGGLLNTATPIYVGISAATGLTTTLATGLDVNCDFNMNSNDINNINSLNGTSGTDITIGSTNQVNINSSDNININSGVNLIVNSTDSVILNANGGSGNAIQLNASNGNIYQQTQYVRLRDGVNDTEILLDMGTTTDQNPRITLNHRGQFSTIYNNDSLNIESEQQLFTTIGKAITIESLNDNTSLFNPSGSVYVDKTTPFTGDGNIYGNFNGNLNGNASTANSANTAGSASTAGSATTASFASYAGQISTTGIASGGGAYSIPFVVSATSLANQTLYTDSNSHLTFNPTTNQLNATGTITNGGMTMNGSASQFLINNNSAITPAISAPNALLVNFPSATITGSVFAGNLSGNSTTTSQANGVFTTSDTTTASNCPIHFGTTSSGNQATKVNSNLNWVPSTNTLNATNIVASLTGTASNSTNSTITDDNTNATFYPVFVSNNTGNLPLKVDKTTNPFSYNPSTGNLTSQIYTITGTPSTANVASTFGQVGLVYIGAVQVAITGSAVSQNLSFANLFNSTYKNYRITLTPTTQPTSSSYPYYALAGFLGTSVPTTAGLFGFEMTSNSTALVSPVYTAFGTTLSTTPLIFAVSSFLNKQIQFDILNVGFATTTTHSVQLNCKSVYSNPGVQGASDRTISATALNGTTITGLTLQQGSVGVGTNFTLEATIYGYNTI